jgi:2-dehydropantoate 2-reductase
MAVFFRPSLRGTYCSMSPDLATGRTEIEAYNGHLIRLAGPFPCALNRAVFALIKRMTNEGLMPNRKHLESLMASLPEKA